MDATSLSSFILIVLDEPARLELLKVREALQQATGQAKRPGYDTTDIRGSSILESRHSKGVILMSDWIDEGKKAPAFTLTAEDGQKVKLADFVGKPIVLYFYPKADTPG